MEVELEVDTGGEMTLGDLTGGDVGEGEPAALSGGDVGEGEPAGS